MTTLAPMQRPEAYAPRPTVIGEHWLELIGILIVALMSVQIWGSIAVLGQLALFMLLIFVRPWAMFDLVTRWSFLFGLPILACMSAGWSWAPEISLRYGVQLLLTALMGALVGRVVGPRAFVRVLFVAMLLVCVGSILSGRKGESATGMVLIGLTGSKNQISYLAQILALSSLGVLADLRQPKVMRMLALASLPMSTWLLIQANAATGLVTTVAGVCVFFAVLTLRAAQPLIRGAVIAAMLVGTIPLAVATPSLVALAQDFTFNVLKKDATLTGRTILWARADDLIRDRPVLGHGFRAAWLSKRVESIGLSRWANQPDARGFHFHDTYREMAVDLGYVGAFIFASGLVLVGLALGWKATTNPTVTTAFLLSLFTVLALRSKGDLVVGPFSIFYAVQGAIAVHALSGVARGFIKLFAHPVPQVNAAAFQRRGARADRM